MAGATTGLVSYRPETSHLEAIPHKVFGCMAAGLPAIASSFPLWGRVVEATDRGIAVNLTNRRDVAKAVQYLIDDRGRGGQDEREWKEGGLGAVRLGTRDQEAPGPVRRSPGSLWDRAMNVWLVNPFDAIPGESVREVRYAFLCRMLAKMGHTVTWWSSDFDHRTKRYRDHGRDSIDIDGRLRVILLPTPSYTKNVSLGRLRHHTVYAREFRRNAMHTGEHPDVILASCPPLLSANAASDVGRRLGAKTVVDGLDFWPEAFKVILPAALRASTNTLFFPLRLLADRAYRQADGIVASNPALLRRALSNPGSGDKPGLMIPLGVDLATFDRFAGETWNDEPYAKHDKAEFRIVYGGTIGKVYDIRTILEVAARLAPHHPQLHFYIAGIGPDYELLRGIAESRRLGNVTFTGLLGYGQFVRLLRESDVCLSAIHPETGDSFPTKLFDYLAAGRPILNSAKGEIERLIRKENLGRLYEARNPDSLARAILDLHSNRGESLRMGERGRRLAEERFDMNKIYPEYEAFLRLVCRRSDRI